MTQAAALALVALSFFFFLVVGTFALEPIVATNGEQHQWPSHGRWKQWQDFKIKYGKSYPQAEEKARFHIFKENLKKLEALPPSPTMKYGITKFFDLTMEEFKNRYLHTLGPARVLPPNDELTTPQSKGLPPSWDWSTKGAVTPVKTEDQCGATWAMAAIDVLESVCKIAGYPLIPLSTQQVVDCDTSGYDQGCNGGFPNGAYTYILDAGGIESESSYPYKGADDNCTVDPKKFVACMLTHTKNVTVGKNEQQLMEFVYSQSPVVICLDAAQNGFLYYTGGVISQQECPGTSLDHCVELVGWDVVDGVSAWKIKNQWGPDWGLDGFAYLQMGTNTCGMDSPYTVAPCVKNTC